MKSVLRASKFYCNDLRNTHGSRIEADAVKIIDLIQQEYSFRLILNEFCGGRAMPMHHKVEIMLRPATLPTQEGVTHPCPMVGMRWTKAWLI